MKFWTPDFARITEGQNGTFVFPEQHPEIVSLLTKLSDEERLRRGLDTLIEEDLDVEVRPDIDMLGILGRTATRGQILCYNLDKLTIFDRLTLDRMEDTLLIVEGLFQTALPYNEGRSSMTF